MDPSVAHSSAPQSPSEATKYILSCVCFALIGFVVGFLIEWTIRKLEGPQPVAGRVAPMVAVGWIVVQLFLVAIAAWVIERYISKRFALEWQATTPGLFFVAGLFGSQFRLYENVEDVWHLS